MPAGWIFIPKTSEAQTKAGQARPGETRPLTLKNSDNKIIASAWLQCLKKPYKGYVDPMQGGFVPGRQFLQNLLDIDTQARLDSMPKNGGQLAHMIFFDFAAAFPSISHEWMWVVIKRME